MEGSAPRGLPAGLAQGSPRADRELPLLCLGNRRDLGIRQERLHLEERHRHWESCWTHAHTVILGYNIHQINYSALLIK